MQYRPFGKLEFKVSALGFGAMRLPVKGGKIDETQATAMLHYAIDHGLNYVDTAYPYHDGESETFLGRALTGAYREKVKVATQLPCWKVKEKKDFDRLLNEQLRRLNRDAVDFYLLHALNKKMWDELCALDVLEWAENAMDKGRFRYFGFSFHDEFPAFKEIVDAYNWDLCLIQYNYMDVDKQAGMKGLQYAAAKGMAVAIMEPLRGGRLVNPPAEVQKIWDQAEEKRSPVEWALQWLWNQPEVSVVLSGMSSMEQVKENIALAEKARVNSLSPAELGLYEKVRAKYEEITVIPCTKCGYCMPCPQGVDIPGNLNNYNEGYVYGRPDMARGLYGWWEKSWRDPDGSLDRDIRAASCIQCGICEEKCPQAIPISRWMPVIHKALGENGPYITKLD